MEVKPNTRGLLKALQDCPPGEGEHLAAHMNVSTVALWSMRYFYSKVKDVFGFCGRFFQLVTARV